MLVLVPLACHYVPTYIFIVYVATSTYFASSLLLIYGSNLLSYGRFRDRDFVYALYLV